MADLPVVHCVKCGRQVDVVETWYNEANRSYVFVARCHGEEETTELLNYDIARSRGFRIVEAKAFEPKKQLHVMTVRINDGNVTPDTWLQIT